MPYHSSALCFYIIMSKLVCSRQNPCQNLIHARNCKHRFFSKLYEHTLCEFVASTPLHATQCLTVRFVASPMFRIVHNFFCRHKVTTMTLMMTWQSTLMVWEVLWRSSLHRWALYFHAMSCLVQTTLTQVVVHLVHLVLNHGRLYSFLIPSAVDTAFGLSAFRSGNSWNFHQRH